MCQGKGYAPPADAREYTLKVKFSEDDDVTQPYVDYEYDNRWDPEGTYTPLYQYYDAFGNGYYDYGKGTYSNSDFHHNGDLNCYEARITRPHNFICTPP